MRTPWRIIFPFLGLFLVGVIGVAAVPYLHHLVYPDSLPRSALKGSIGYAATPDLRQIDELGDPSHIQTEADARAYIEALVKRWGPRETTYPDLTDRLARAEYAAARNPERLIPESQIAETFNRLMDEWEMPSWTRISVPELHAFRIRYALTVYPRSVARLPDESIAPSCRPTEALFLLHMLDSREGIPPDVREEVRESHFPWSVLKSLKRSRPERPIEPGLHPAYTSTPEESLHRNEYIGLRRKYFATHPAISFESEVADIFSQFGI
jgi:hypothetical protein